MYRIKFTTAYKKGYKRAKKRGMNINLLDSVAETFGNGKSCGYIREIGNCGNLFICFPQFLFFYKNSSPQATPDRMSHSRMPIFPIPA